MTKNSCPQCNQRMTLDGKNYCSYCGCPYRSKAPISPFLIGAYIFGAFQALPLVYLVAGYDIRYRELPAPMNSVTQWTGICAVVFLVLGFWDTARRRKIVAISEDEWMEENVHIHGKIRRKDLISLFLLGTAMNALYLWSFYLTFQVHPIGGKILYCGIVYLLLMGCPYVVRKISKRHVNKRLNEYQSRVKS